MDSFTLPDDFRDGFSSVSAPDGATAVLHFTSETGNMSADLIEDLYLPRELTMMTAVTNHTEPSPSLEDLAFRAVFTPVAFGRNEVESRAPQAIIDSHHDVVTAAADFDPSKPQEHPMPMLNTPGFVALQRAEAMANPVGRQRRPRKYEPIQNSSFFSLPFKKIQTEKSDCLGGKQQDRSYGEITM
jgi:hypothetical protein